MWKAIPALFAALDARPAGAGDRGARRRRLAFAAGADISEFDTVRATAEGGQAYEAANEAAFARSAAPPSP